MLMVFGLFSIVPAVASETDGLTQKTTNLSIVTPEQGQDGKTESGETWANKNARLAADSKYADTVLKVDNIHCQDVAALGENLLTAGWWGYSTALTPNLVLSDQRITDITDGNIYEIAKDGTTVNTGGASCLASNWGMSTATDKGAARFESGNYDAVVAFDLGATTAIDTIFSFTHPNYNFSWATYKIYVADTMADLYKPENWVASFDYCNGYSGGPTYSLNGVHNSAVVANRRSEGQIWSFTGTDKPVGRFIGYKVYDATVTADKYMSIYELGATGQKVFEIIKPENLTTESGIAWALKAEKLNAGSNYKGTTLQVDNFNDATLQGIAAEKGANHVVAFELKDAADKVVRNRKGDTAFTYITDLDIFDNAGKNTAYGSSGIGSPLTYSSSTQRGAARFTSGDFDVTFTLELDAETEIDTLYSITHPNVPYAWTTYKVYVGNDKDTLYKTKEVLRFDYYEGYKGQDANYSLNGVQTSGAANRRSEGQIWRFNGEKPVGKYVGFKIYEAEMAGKRLDLYDIGVYGNARYTVADITAVESSVAEGAAVNTVCEVDAGATVSAVDAEGQAATYMENGKKYTLTVSGAADGYTFDGWYKAGVKVSSDASYTIDSYVVGDNYVAKYVTDIIFDLDPSTADLYFSDTIRSAYDEEENAVSINNLGKGINTVPSMFNVGKNPASAYRTEFAPWTTYKVTVKAKIVSNTEQAEKIVFTPYPSALGGTAQYLYSGRDYTTISFIFNSGAADFSRDGVTSGVATQRISTNCFNISTSELTENGNVELLVKQYTIERIDNVVVDADNATVTLNDANQIKWSTNGSFKTYNKGITADAEAYGGYGLTSNAGQDSALIDNVNTWRKEDMEKAGIVGAANGTVSFTVAADKGYQVDQVTVNGKVVEAQDGVYTTDYVAQVLANNGTAEKDYSNSQVAKIVVKTSVKPITYYTVKYMDGEKEIASFQVEEGQTLAEIPAVPTKDGYNSVWDLDLAGKAIDGDKTVNAVHTIKTYTVTYYAFDEIIGEAQTVEHGADAVAPSAPTVEGYTFKGWDKADTNIVADTEIKAVYEINTYTVTYIADGKVVDTQTVEWGSDAVAPAVPEKANHTGAWDADGKNIKADTTINAVYTFTGFVVTFESAAGVVLGEVVVVEGQVPDYNEVKAINEKVANIYGYEIAVNDAGDVIWDKDVYTEAIVSNITVRPFYKAQDISTAITLYNLDSKTEYYDHHTQQYDTAITLSCEGAKSWVDENGNVLLDTATGTLYACGSRMKLYPVSEQKTAPAVAIVGKVNDGNYSVFAHVNVADATEYGVVYASKTAYDNGNNADFNLEDAALDAEKVAAGIKAQASYTVVKIDATKVGQVDFVATLEGTGDKTRYARAFVKVGDEYIYTTATCNK